MGKHSRVYSSIRFSIRIVLPCTWRIFGRILAIALERTLLS
jgi:hypothetical protein